MMAAGTRRPAGARGGHATTPSSEAAGLADLWPFALPLAGLGTAIFGLGVWRFRRQFG